MPSPSKPQVIAATLTNAVTGRTVKVTNLTTGGSTTVAMNSLGQITLDLTNMTLSCADGDSILIERQDNYIGGTKITVEEGKAFPKISITTTANATPSISL